MKRCSSAILTLSTVNARDAVPEPAAALTGAIFYAGAWKGVLLLECSEDQARDWTSRLMGVPDPTPDDARDGLGEVTNVLAGNLKRLLAPGVGISTPTVIAGSDYGFHISREGRTERVAFTDDQGTFQVTFVLTGDAPAGAA